MGKLIRARDYAASSLALQERVSNVWAIAHTLSGLAEILIRLGSWEEARDYVARGVELARSTDSSWWGVYPIFVLGHLQVVGGEWTEARRTLEEAIARAESTKDLQAECAASLPLAALDLREGRPEAAMARLESLLQRSGWDDKDVVPLLPRPGRSISGLREGGYGRVGAARGRQASQGAI